MTQPNNNHQLYTLLQHLSSPLPPILQSYLSLSYTFTTCPSSSLLFLLVPSPSLLSPHTHVQITYITDKGKERCDQTSGTEDESSTRATSDHICQTLRAHLLATPTSPCIRLATPMTTVVYLESYQATLILIPALSQPHPK